MDASTKVQGEMNQLSNGNSGSGMKIRIDFRISIILILFWCIILFPVSGSADQSNTLFLMANKAYSEGKYQESIDLYQQILGSGKASGEVYFNLGNAYYKLNQIGRAILYYEKAQLYLAGDEALDQNLKLARLKIIDKIEPIPKLFLVEWWNVALNVFSMSVFAWVCFGLFTLVLFWVALYLLSSRRILIRLAWITGIIFLVMALIFIGKIYQFETSHYGIILADKISVTGEPSLSGQELFILHQGTKVRINRSLDGWYEISLEDGKTGWIKMDGLETI
jgi:tetratricopeptide (TPR) repeat protein